ncbi:MAG: hypothetical protein HFI78_15185 [Lachnospiraceae bacterium]|jgi:hypothetical protein|nr:hypothetical protein [Lachnospiraceae bacterium]
MASFAVIIKGMLWQEQRNGRVIMGYFLGFTVMGYWMNGFLRYAVDIGEPVNILEAFCVVEQHYVNMLFLVLGWLLAVSDAPFMKGNIYLLLYRCGRKRWNMGMFFYILMQAFLYTGAMAAFTIIISSFFGFVGNMWSSPVYSLAHDVTNSIGAKYNITFPWLAMMKAMSVPQAFAVTFLFLYLYLAFIGAFLYTAALLFSGIAGMMAVMGVHLTGYLQMMDGYTDISLLARAVPGNFVDGTSYWQSAALFLALIAFLMVLSSIFVKKMEFQSGTEAEG